VWGWVLTSGNSSRTDTKIYSGNCVCRYTFLSICIRLRAHIASQIPQMYMQVHTHTCRARMNVHAYKIFFRNTVQRACTCCEKPKKLQHTACSALQHTARRCNTATHCNTMQQTATNCNTLQHAATWVYQTHACRMHVCINVHSYVRTCIIRTYAHSYNYAFV